MSLNNFFRDVALQNAKKQAVMIDAVTEEAPIMAMLPMQEASHGLRNVYEELKSIQGAQLVNLDDELPSMNVESDLKYQDLGVLGGIIEVGEDKAKKMGGAKAYFARMMPSILRETGANTEKSFIYNNFRPYAKANGREIDSGGATADSQYSMVCVKWSPGESTGLYDPQGFGNGKAFDMLPINGGNVYKETVDNKSVLLYGLRIKAYMALQLSNPRNVSSIVNIQLTGTTAIPTKAQVNKMIRNARGNPGNTLIYTHPAVIDALGEEYKSSIVRMASGEKEVNTMITAWNGIRMIGSYNFDDGTEAVVS